MAAGQLHRLAPNPATSILWDDVLRHNTGSVGVPCDEIRQVLNSSLAPSTIQSYSHHLSEFQSFLLSRGITPNYPQDETVIMSFLLKKKQQNILYSTLQGYVSAVAFAHKIRGLRDPTSTFFFRKFMQGLKRISHIAQQLQPISFSMLRELESLVPSLHTDYYTKTLLRALMSLMYHACLRISEVTVSPTADHAIKAEDLVFMGKPPLLLPQFVSITLQSFKHSKESQTIRVSSSPQKDVCPVTLLGEYYALRPSSRYVFCHPSGAPLTRTFIMGWLRKLVALSSFSSQRINTHSFRIGRTTDLVIAGKVSDTYIQHVGRWSSSAYRKYVRSIVIL